MNLLPRVTYLLQLFIMKYLVRYQTLDIQLERTLILLK